MFSQLSRSKDPQSRGPLALVSAVVVTAALVVVGLPNIAFAAPAPPTVQIADGGDGFVNATEVAGGLMLNGTYDSADPAISRVFARITNDAACSAAAAGTPTQDATLNSVAGTWTAGPFNVSSLATFPEGGSLCARTRSEAAPGDQSAAAFSNVTVKDTVSPAAGSIAIDDGDGFVNATEAASGVSVTLANSDVSAASSSVSFKDGASAIPAGCGPTAAPADGSSSLSAACISALPEGGFTGEAIWSDAAGNLSATVSTPSTKDTIAPTASISLADGDGFVNSSEASSGVPVTWSVSDTGPGVTVSATNGGPAPSGCSWSGLARAATGAITNSCFSVLSDGPVTVTVDGTDSAGNPAQATASTTLNTSGPATTAAFVASTINSASQTSVIVDGTTEPGASVSVVLDDGPTSLGAVVATADGSGVWSTSHDASSLADGTITATATATDGIGNTGTANASAVKDATAPAAAIISTPSEGVTVGSSLVNLTGTAEPDATLELFDGATSIGTTTADPAGNWSTTLSFADGTAAVVARATDTFGNTGPDSAVRSFTIDTIAPPAGTLAITDTDGYVNAAEVTSGVPATWDAAPGSDATSAVVWFADSDGNVPSGCGPFTVGASGTGALNETCAANLPEGQLSFRGTWSDSVGNTSDEGFTTSIKDSVAPEAPVITVPTEGKETRFPAGNIEGTTETGATVEVLEGTDSHGVSDPADGSGAWTLTPTAFTEAPHAIVARATDVAGNTGSDSATRNFTVDVTAPVVPTMDTPVDGSTLGSQSVTVTGTTEPYAIVQLQDGATDQGTTTADSSGAYSLATTLSDGVHVLTVRATDAAGNNSEYGSPTTVTIDTTPPDLGTLVIDDGDGFLNAAEVVSGVPATWQEASGSDAVSASVWFEDADGNVPAGCGPFSVGVNGTGSVNPTCAANLAEGQFSFKGTWTDAIGNTSAPASIGSVKDSIAPVATISITDGDGFMSADEAAVGVPVNWTLTESGPPVTVSFANTSSPTKPACSFGGQSRGPTTGAIPPSCFAVLIDGQVTAKVSGTDAAGNPASATATSILRRTAGLVSIEVLDGEDNPDGSKPYPGAGIIDDVANSEDTVDGSALGVRVDLDPATVVGVVTATLSVSDGTNPPVVVSKAMEAASSVATRTVSADVRGLKEGLLSVTVSVVDGLNNVTVATGSTTLDLKAPTTSMTTKDKSEFIGIHLFLVNFGTVTFAGTTAESPATSNIQWVYVEGRETSSGQVFGRTAKMSKPDASSVSWTLDLPLPAGEWVVTAFSQDTAGNVGAPSAPITIYVDGI